MRERSGELDAWQQNLLAGALRYTRTWRETGVDTKRTASKLEPRGRRGILREREKCKKGIRGLIVM